MKTNPNGSVSASLFTYGTPHEVVKTSFDIGDGRMLDSVPAEYFYACLFEKVNISVTTESKNYHNLLFATAPLSQLLFH